MKEGDEYSLMAAVANAGPVAVGVDASSKAFRVSDWLGIYSWRYFENFILFTQMCRIRH